MRGTPATSTDATGASGSGPAWDRVTLAFSALFAALLLLAVASLVDPTFGLGAPLADGILVPCAGILIGLAARRKGGPGARPILVVTSIVTVTVLATDLAWPPFGEYPRLGGIVLPALAAVLAALATFVALRMDGVAASPSNLVRSARHRATAGILVGLVVLSIGVQLVADLGSIANLSSVDLGQYAASVISTRVGILAIALVAWWWGTGWLLIVTGLSTVVGVVTYALGYGLSASTIPAGLFGIVSLIAGLRPPRPDPEHPRPSAPESPPSRPTVAAVWAILGALLLIPTLFLGRILVSFGDCFGSCPVPSPLAGLAGALDIPLVLLLSILALRLAIVPRSSGPPDRLPPLVGLTAALFILVQIVLGQLGTSPFEFMGFAAPATLLIGLGFGAALLPDRSAQAGALAAFAIGCLVCVWVWSSFVFSYGIAWPLHFSALVEAGVAALALAVTLGPGERSVVARVPPDQPSSTQAT